MLVAASVLALDFTQVKEKAKELNKQVDWLHYDVMDGNFVPNISFGPKILTDLKQVITLPFDVHIMVNNPLFYADVFTKLGIASLTFHYEACADLAACAECIALIKSRHVKVGISVKPQTAVNEIVPLLKDLDLVLVMAVEPGFGGQQFMPESYAKLFYLKAYREKMHLNYLLEVDGGVNDTNARKLVLSGADVLVSGSYLFKGDMAAQVQKLRQ